MYVSKMEALEVYLSSVNALFFNDVPLDRLEELRDRLAAIGQQMNNIQNRADSEKRDLSEAEIAELDQLLTDFNSTEDEIDRRENIVAVNNRLNDPAGRVTLLDTGDDDPDEGGTPAQPQGPTRARAAVRPRIPAQPRDVEEAGRHGFRSLGEFAMSVKAAQRAGPGQIDPRLIKNAPTTIGTEGTGADGGFAVPPDFRREIMVKVMGEESLIGRTDQLTSSSNSITLPKDETTPWQTSGGVLANWEGEAAQLTQSKPNLGQETIRLNKLTSLVPVTEELMDDAPAMTTYLRRKVPEKFNFKINDAIVNGTGAGMPKGLLAADAKVEVAKESGQVADTIVFQNIVNMWSRLYSGCRSNAIWLINQDIEPQLLSMAFPGTGTAVPVYLPPGGLSQTPFGTLMGKPVIPTEACQTLGDAGDVILTDLRQYLTAVKTSGIRQDVSMHLWFDYDITAFRFIMRVAGQSWWGSAISPKNGSATRSCVVTLAARG
jgi:HK97 family phage major capsid protein